MALTIQLQQTVTKYLQSSISGQSLKQLLLSWTWRRRRVEVIEDANNILNVVVGDIVFLWGLRAFIDICVQRFPFVSQELLLDWPFVHTAPEFDQLDPVCFEPSTIGPHLCSAHTKFLLFGKVNHRHPAKEDSNLFLFPSYVWSITYTSVEIKFPNNSFHFSNYRTT